MRVPRGSGNSLSLGAAKAKNWAAAPFLREGATEHIVASALSSIRSHYFFINIELFKLLIINTLRT